MKKKNRKPLVPDETPLQFFQALKIPEKWRFIEKDKFQYASHPQSWSYGYWYWVKERLKVRIDFITPAHRGGLLEVDMKHLDPKKTNICSNMQSAELNEFIESRYGEVK